MTFESLLKRMLTKGCTIEMGTSTCPVVSIKSKRSQRSANLVSALEESRKKLCQWRSQVMESFVDDHRKTVIVIYRRSDIEYSECDSSFPKKKKNKKQNLKQTFSKLTFCGLDSSFDS